MVVSLTIGSRTKIFNKKNVTMKYSLILCQRVIKLYGHVIFSSNFSKKVEIFVYGLLFKRLFAKKNKERHKTE